VIAETNAFQTRFARIVVTDDAGRFVIPDLPAADYQVWVRGYGLSDSDKTAAKPGATVNLTAKIAATPADAAKVYPAIYWYSMQKLPTPSEVSKLSGGVDQYVASIKNLRASAAIRSDSSRRARFRPRSGTARKAGCGASSRVRPAARCSRRRRTSSAACRRNTSATGPIASRPASCRTRSHPRPHGIERNVVATVYDWATPSVGTCTT